MTLNKQLLCVSMVLLCLPWAGCQYLREMDTLLRDSQEQTLMASARAISAVLSQQPTLLYPHAELAQIDGQGEDDNALYFHPLSAPLWVDGYNEGWENIPAETYSNPTNPNQTINYRSATHEQQLFLLFEVTDDEVSYNNPAQSLIDDGDRLVLVTGTGAEYIFTTAAPGKITVRYINGPLGIYRESKINAYWQDTAQGYTIELSLPFKLAAGRMSFYVIDQDSNNVSQYSPLKADQLLSPPLYVYQPADLRQQLSIFEQPGIQLRVIDHNHRTLAQLGDLQSTPPPTGHWLIRKLYRKLLNSAHNLNTEISHNNTAAAFNREEALSAIRGKPASEWYKDSNHPNQRILAAAVPVAIDQEEYSQTIAAVIIEQSSEQLAALSDSAFGNLLLLSLGAICSVAIALLGYASWLSWRIRRLSRAANEVLAEDGKLLDNFPTSQSADEVGDLTRNYAHLLNRLREYTHYLQTLSRKLSHELRTPLAIIHSSLDNLDNQSLDKQSNIYQQRAKEGALRLGKILTAMSEATRVEESIEQAEWEVVDMQQLLSGVTQAYQDLYRDKSIVFLHQGDTATEQPVNVVPELIVQMLDKLFDNANSFCPDGGKIELTLSYQLSNIIICVTNDGPVLPEKMRTQLFDNMVSLREDNTQTSHLGLGLHIANLIVKYHNGVISAGNREDNSGVIFTIVLPC